MLKKAFQLPEKDPVVADINKIEAAIQVNMYLLNELKTELKKDSFRRNELVNEILLQKYGYIIGPADRIYYVGQTGKILIYTQDNKQENNEPTYQ